MKKTIWIFLLFFTFAAVGFAQQDESKAKDSERVILKAGTKISAQFNQQLNVETIKSGDDFVMTLTEDVSGGGVLFSKGTELLGRVVRAKLVDNDDKTSEISLSFDFLKNGDDYLRFKAVIVSGVNGANKLVDIKFEPSEIFKNATVISTKGKNLKIDEGIVCSLKLELDLLKP